MDCCGNDEVLSRGLVRDRKCRDALCIVFFLAFWAGMIAICVLAFDLGDVNRLVYGIDSYGFTCGSQNVWNGTVIDNTNRTSLYMLNPIAATTQLPFVKTVCVAECPTPVCDAPDALPCVQPQQFVCPYYALAPYNLYGQLPGVAPDSVSWYDALPSMAPIADPLAPATILRLQSMQSPFWVPQWVVLNNIQPYQNVTGSYYQLTSQFPGAGPCYPVYTPTVRYGNRCFPNYPGNLTTYLSPVAGSPTADNTPDISAPVSAYNTRANRWARYVGNISQGIVIIVAAGLGAGVLLSGIWVLLSRLSEGFMSWVTLLFVQLGCVGVTLFSFALAGMLSLHGIAEGISQAFTYSATDPTSVERSTWKWIGIAAAITTGVVLVIVLLCLSRLRVSLACLHLANQYITALPSLLLVPSLSVALEVVLVVYWVSVTAMLYTAGDVTAKCRLTSAPPYTYTPLLGFYDASAWAGASNSEAYTCYADQDSDTRIQLCANNPNCYITYEWNWRLRWSLIYHFFGFLWTSQFLSGVCCVTVAGAVADVYWAAGDSKQLKPFPVLSSLGRAVSYHLGSAMFGGLWMALFFPVRFVFEYADRQIKWLQAQGVMCSPLACCVNCLGYVITTLTNYFNRNGYAVVGIKGVGYCSASQRASTLLVSNAKRIVTVDVVGDILLFLAKIAIGSICGCVAFAIWTLPVYNSPDTHPETYIPSPILPVAFSILVGFCVADAFLAPYAMTLETLILCFCEDCRLNDGQPKNAPETLLRALGIKRMTIGSNAVEPEPLPGHLASLQLQQQAAVAAPQQQSMEAVAAAGAAAQPAAAAVEVRPPAKSPWVPPWRFRPLPEQLQPQQPAVQAAQVLQALQPQQPAQVPARLPQPSLQPHSLLQSQQPLQVQQPGLTSSHPQQPGLLGQQPALQPRPSQSRPLAPLQGYSPGSAAATQPAAQPLGAQQAGTAANFLQPAAWPQQQQAPQGFPAASPAPWLQPPLPPGPPPAAALVGPAAPQPVMPLQPHAPGRPGL